MSNEFRPLFGASARSYDDDRGSAAIDRLAPWSRPGRSSAGSWASPQIKFVRHSSQPFELQRLKAGNRSHGVRRTAELARHRRGHITRLKP
jgi:hypothetical protein